MLDYKSKKELLFLLEEENFSLLENEIINTEGKIVYYFSLYDLESRFVEKKYSVEINKLLALKMTMDENIPDKYEKLLNLGLLKDSSNNVLDELFISSKTRFSMNYNTNNLSEQLEHWKNFKKIIDKKIKIKIDVSFLLSFINCFKESLKLIDKNEDAKYLVELFNDIKLNVLKNLNDDDFTASVIKNIGLNYWENRYPVTQEDYLVFNVLLSLKGSFEGETFHSVNENYLHLLNPEYLNLWLDNSKQYKVNINKVNKIKKQLHNDPKFWESSDSNFIIKYTMKMVDDNRIDELKNLLNNKEIAHYIVYGLWLIEEKGNKYRNVGDELLKDLAPEKILELFFEKMKIKTNDYEVARFYNMTLNGNSKVWKNVFLNDNFFKYIIYGNNYNDGRLTVLEKNVAKDVEDYISDYISRKVDSKKIKLSEVLVASTMLIQSESVEVSKISFKILKALKKAQDEIFGDEMDYVNFIYDSAALKNIGSHINLLNKKQKKEIEGLLCFRENYKLWDDSKSKMDFFKKFHEMYIIGSLNNIQKIPDHKIRELNMMTMDKPSVYLTSSVHNNQRMFVNEHREAEIVSVWLKNAFDKKDEKIINSLFDKFKSVINLLRVQSDKFRFITSVHEALNKLPGFEDLYKNHSFFKMDEHQEYVKKMYNKIINKLNYQENLPLFIVKDLWNDVVNSENKENVESFVIGLFKYTNNPELVVDYLKENKDIMNVLIKKDLNDSYDNILNRSKVGENLKICGFIKNNENTSLLDICNDLEKLNAFEIIRKENLSDKNLIDKFTTDLINDTKKQVYNLINKKQSNPDYSKDELKLIEDLKIINEKYIEILPYIVPEVTVNDIKKPNIKFMKEMPAMYACFMHMNQNTLDISGFKEKDKKNIYNLIEFSEKFNNDMYNAYKRQKEKNNMPLAFSLLLSYIKDNEDLSRIRTKGLFSYVDILRDDFKSYIEEKKISTRDILKMSSLLLQDNDLFNIVYEILSKHVENNLINLESNEILSLMEFNNSYIINKKVEKLQPSSNYKGVDSNVFNCELLEPAFEKLIMKNELEKIDKVKIKKSVMKF